MNVLTLFLDGPLYIIVEYAEYGSLRSYLRKSRRLEFKSCTSDDSGVDSLASGNQADHLLSEYQVNPRDLLSFAWQIAKGMEYLSEMKVNDFNHMNEFNFLLLYQLMFWFKL